jgi:hypothetical protein
MPDISVVTPVMASADDVLPAIVFSGRHRRYDRTYVYLDTPGGGAGPPAEREAARRDEDARSGKAPDRRPA